MQKIKTLPHNLDAEIALLGGCLLNNRIIRHISGIIDPEDFYRDANKIIFSVMQDMDGDGVEIDLVTLAAHLDRTGNLQKVGGNEYLSGIADAVSISAGWRAHAALIKELSNLRNTINLCTSTIESIYKKYSYEDVKESLKQGILNIEKDQDVALEDNAKFYARVYDSLYLAREPGLEPGIECLNNRLCFEKGYIHAIAAESGVGKSAIMLQMADNISMEYGTCLYYSLESTRQMLALRLVARHARIALTRLHKSNFTDAGQEEKIMEAINRLSLSRLILIDDERLIEIEKLVSHAESYALQNKISCIFLDYLQLAQSNRRFNSDKQRIDNNIFQLKSLAKRLNVPIIYGCQLRKDVGGRPSLDDLYESNVIRQATDNIIMMYAPNSDPAEYEVEVFLAKGKEQQRFSEWLHFNGHFQVFTRGIEPEVTTSKRKGVIL